MTENALVELSTIVTLGIGATWLASRLRLPSILILLITGFVAGPLTGMLNPDVLFGNALFPFVSLSVAIILFEGGMNLKFRELKDSRNAVIRLVVLGALITWVLSSGLAYLVLGMPLSLCILLGAILIVTGPTVIMPLLHFIRPSRRTETLIKWEGIINDPIGAIIAVVVYEVILSSLVGHAGSSAAWNLLKSLSIGILLGALGAFVLIRIIKRQWVSDYLQNPVTLMLVIMVFTVTNQMAEEAGLLAVTVMGMFLANQKQIQIKHIVAFKEELRVVLISVLFIVLSARIELEMIKQIGWGTLFFLLGMLFIVRPAAVFLSCRRTELKHKEKIFLSWMAPRGIVAAAVTSVFALRLTESGFAEAEQLVPEIFLLIVGTVAVYGLTAKPLAKMLQLAAKNDEGLLIVGAHAWARQLAASLAEEGNRVVMVDTNRENVKEARLAGVEAHHGNILSEEMLDLVNLSGIGAMVALTPNDEINALAALHCSDIFGRSRVYHLVPKEEASTRHAGSAHLRGQILGKENMTFEIMNYHFNKGAVIKKTALTDNFTYNDFVDEYEEEVFPVLIIKEDNTIRIQTPEGEDPKPGEKILAIVQQSAE